MVHSFTEYSFAAETDSLQLRLYSADGQSWLPAVCSYVFDDYKTMCPSVGFPTLPGPDCVTVVNNQPHVGWWRGRSGG